MSSEGVSGTRKTIPLLPGKKQQNNQHKSKTIQYVLVLSYYSHFLKLTLLEDTPAK